MATEYLKIPNTNITLTEGTIVTIDRFPGMRWITHYGWYNFENQQYNGWYFSSIPAQMILPANTFDLKLVSVVSSNDSYTPPIPGGPVAPPHPPGFIPGNVPGPYVPGGPPGFPPPPPPFCPHDHNPDMRPAIFTEANKKALASAFISVPNLKDRDAINTDFIPDGKIVRVNSVDGITKYYEWSKFNDRWQEMDLITPDELENRLSDITADINDVISDVEQNTSNIAQIQEDMDNVGTTISSISDTVTEFGSTLEIAQGAIAANTANIVAAEDRFNGRIDSESAAIRSELESATNQLDAHEDRIDTVEDTLFNIKKVIDLSGDNTVVVVKDGTIGDSKVSIGDGEITETSEYASAKVLATEKGVVGKVEASQTRWQAF